MITMDNVGQVSVAIRELLRGLGPRIQGAILGDLVSLWLAGHFEPSEAALPIGSERPLTAALRETVLSEFMELVCDLVPVSEQEILRNIEPEGHA